MDDQPQEAPMLRAKLAAERPELARLRAEVERLNETLQIMADCGMSPHWVGKLDIPAAVRKLARAALSDGDAP